MKVCIEGFAGEEVFMVKPEKESRYLIGKD